MEHMTGSDPRFLANLALTDTIGRNPKKRANKRRRFFKGRKAVKVILPMINL